MIISLPKSIEDKISTLPPEEIENALLQLAEKHGYNRKTDLEDELQKGLDDIEQVKVASASTQEERKALFEASRARVLKKAEQ